MKFDYHYFLRRYQEIENDYLEITDFIEPEPDFHSQCYKFGSSKLMDFCLKVCTEIETLFVLILDNKEFDSIQDIDKKRRYQNIDTYREIIEPKYNLSDYTLFVKHIKKEISPFEKFNVQTPYWFKWYSKYKHDKIWLIKMWNLKHALYALGALLLLIINHPELKGRAMDRRKINCKVFDLMDSKPRFCTSCMIEDSGEKYVL